MGKIATFVTMVMFFSTHALADSVWFDFAGPQRQMVSEGIGPKSFSVGLNGNYKGVKIKVMVRKWGTLDKIFTSTFTPRSGEVTIKFNVKDIGIFNVFLEAIKDGKSIGAGETTYSVVPEIGYIRPKEMGVCTHFSINERSYKTVFELLKLAGFCRTRDDLFWNDIEPKAKQYRIRPEVERYVDTAIKYKIKPLFVTGYNNTRAYPKDFKKGFPTTQKMYDAYANAVAFAVKYFKGRVWEWEIWNEPNSANVLKEYLPLLKTVYKKIKQEDPQAIVISCGGGGAGGGPGGAMIFPLVGAGGIEYMDGFSIHPYMSPYEPDFGYYCSNSPIPNVSIPRVTSHLNNFIRQHKKADGSKLKLYITELGWPVEFESTRNVPVTLITQAAFLARTFLLNRACTNQPLYWYDFRNDGKDARFKEHNFGLVNNDYSPKPAYQAAAIVASLLRDLLFVRAIKDGKVTSGNNRSALEDGHIKLYLYAKDNQKFLACWSSEQSNNKYKVKFKLPFAYAEAKLLDWQGAEQKMPKLQEDNRIELKVSALPYYIVKK